MRGPRGWRVPAALLASIVATLLLCEFVARRFPPPRYFALWQWDPIVGHAPIPSFKTSIDWWVSEGLPVIHYETNGWGFRDREFSAARRPGVSRVLVLGDSFAEAAEVEANERFSARLEERLARPGREVEVWNMGIGDFGTADETLLFEEYASRVKPDVVLLEMFPLNDVVNNGRAFAGDNESDGDYLRPYFVLGPDGELRRDDPNPLRSWLRRHSLAFAHLEFAVLSLRAARRIRAGESRAMAVRQSHVARGEFPILEHRILLDEPASPAWEDAWAVTRALLLRLRESVRSSGAELVVALVPCREEYSPMALASRAAAIEQATGERHQWDPAGASRRLCEMLAAADVPCVALRSRFEEVFGDEGYKHERHGHFDPIAHQLIADTVAPAVEEALARHALTRPEAER